MAKLKKPLIALSTGDGLKKKLFKKVSLKKSSRSENKLNKHVEKSKIKKKQKANISKDFDDTIPKYNINIIDVKNAIKGVTKFRRENPKLQNELFNESAPLFLQIGCHKIPRGYSKIFRIPLKYSLYTADSEICLVTSEVKGIRNIDHEQHIEHYEKLLQDKGVQNIKKIMTFHEFRTSYETFEQRNRLVDLYDIFLADSKISGKLVKKCGKIFYKKRKIPTPVKLQVTKLKDHIEKALCKAYLNLHLKGNSYMVQFGHTNMTEDQLVENFKSILDFLDKAFPGGVDNISGLSVYAPRGSSIPVYISTKLAKDIVVPKVMSKKPKAFKVVKDELTTRPNTEIMVRPSGKVIVKRTRDNDGENARKKMKINEENVDEFKEEVLTIKKKKKAPIKNELSEVDRNKREIDANSIKQNTERKKKSRVREVNVDEVSSTKKKKTITDELSEVKESSDAAGIKQSTKHKNKVLIRKVNNDEATEIMTMTKKKKTVITDKPTKAKKNKEVTDVTSVEQTDVSSVEQTLKRKKKIQNGDENINGVKKDVSTVKKKKATITNGLRPVKKIKKNKSETEIAARKESIKHKKEKKNKKTRNRIDFSF